MKTIFNKRSIYLLMMIGLTTAIISSCKKDDDVDNTPVVFGDAKLMAVNAVQGSTAQDVYQGDTKISTTAVTYGNTTGYITVKGGYSTISFKNTGSTTINTSRNVGFATGSSSTIYYYSNGSGSVLAGEVADDLTVPAAGKASVTFLNLGVGLNNTVNVNIASSGALLISGLAFQTLSSTKIIDANTDLNFNVVGVTTASTIPGSTFQSGKIYTVWFDAASSTSANYHVVQHN